ncbi:hypothetical protein V8C26DRAFT_205877 [Trichoderma gracile]
MTCLPAFAGSLSLFLSLSRGLLYPLSQGFFIAVKRPDSGIHLCSPPLMTLLIDGSVIILSSSYSRCDRDALSDRRCAPSPSDDMPFLFRSDGTHVSDAAAGHRQGWWRPFAAGLDDIKHFCMALHSSRCSSKRYWTVPASPAAVKSSQASDGHTLPVDITHTPSPSIPPFICPIAPQGTANPFATATRSGATHAMGTGDLKAAHSASVFSEAAGCVCTRMCVVVGVVVVAAKEGDWSRWNPLDSRCTRFRLLLDAEPGACELNPCGDR